MSGAGDVNISDMTVYASSDFNSDATDATEVFLVGGTNNAHSKRLKFNHGSGSTLVGESNGNKYVQVVRTASNQYVNIELGIGWDADAPDSLGGSTHQVVELAVTGKYMTTGTWPSNCYASLGLGPQGNPTAYVRVSEAVATWTDFTVAIGSSTVPRDQWTAWKFFGDILPNVGCEDISLFLDDLAIYAKAAPKA